MWNKDGIYAVAFFYLDFQTFLGERLTRNADFLSADDHEDNYDDDDDDNNFDNINKDNHKVKKQRQPQSQHEDICKEDHIDNHKGNQEP